MIENGSRDGGLTVCSQTVGCSQSNKLNVADETGRRTTSNASSRRVRGRGRQRNWTVLAACA